jgi:hypothetical protein
MEGLMEACDVFCESLEVGWAGWSAATGWLLDSLSGDRRMAGWTLDVMLRVGFSGDLESWRGMGMWMGSLWRRMGEQYVSLPSLPFSSLPFLFP